jgi:hypothetical protein
MVLLCRVHQVAVRKALDDCGLVSWTSPYLASDDLLADFDPEFIVKMCLEQQLDELMASLCENRCVICTMGDMHDAECITPGCHFQDDACIAEAVRLAVAELMSSTQGMPN